MATTEQQPPTAILEQAGLTVEQLYDELTDDCTRPVRLEELVYEAAERVPGLVPTRAEIDVERTRKLADKEGLELAQGLLLAEMLAIPRTGLHLVESMLYPTELALERLDELRATGTVDLGHARVTRRGRAGVLELRNPRHLNAEDGDTLAETEVAVDLVLLDPEIEVGVFRGGVVDHPRYAGERIFGAGINLTHLYHGRIDFLFYVVRDMGYVNKLFRGLAGTDDADRREAVGRRGREVRDRRRLPAPARDGPRDRGSRRRGCTCRRARRGSSPAPPTCGCRGSSATAPPGRRSCPAASGRPATPTPTCICDEVVEHGRDRGRDRSADRGAHQLGAGQRRRQPRARCASARSRSTCSASTWPRTAREQAYCHLSPALVRNLEEHWNADRRSV